MVVLVFRYFVVEMISGGGGGGGVVLSISGGVLCRKIAIEFASMGQ
jgi:hypothetical protein